MKLTQTKSRWWSAYGAGESWKPVGAIAHGRNAVEKGDSGSTLGDYETWRDAILKEREKRAKLMSMAIEKRKP